MKPHVAVVGAGAFGAWTAHHLAVSGCQVTLIDAYGPANPRASSGDHSRILRCGYGADEIYSRMARRSLELWREFAARRGADRLPIWHPCGVLWLAAGEDAYTAATRDTLTKGGYRFTSLAPEELRARYPYLAIDDINTALLEPDCGVLTARRAVRSLVTELASSGVRVVRARVQPLTASGPLRSIPLDDGNELRADTYVFACGAWLPALLPRLLEGRIRPTRQVVVYFGVPAGGRFGPLEMPAWIDFPAGIYGIPDLDDHGVKVGIDTHGPVIDPDSMDRIADAESVTKAREWLTRRIPALAGAPVVEARVCQYENTATGDFLIDRHPDHENAWIVGGGSGHGFKHGPAVGEYAARMVLQEGRPEPRFALREPEIGARRAVY